MSRRRIVALSLIAAPLLLIGSTWNRAREVHARFEAAGSEILLSTDGKTKSRGEFTITYAHAHGCEVTNAIEANSEFAPDVFVVWQRSTSRDSVGLAFKPGERVRFRPPHNTPLTVEVDSHFPGTMEFHNSVCGCEVMGPKLVQFGSFIIGAPMLLMGLFLLVPTRGSPSCRVR